LTIRVPLKLQSVHIELYSSVGHHDGVKEAGSKVVIRDSFLAPDRSHDYAEP